MTDRQYSFDGGYSFRLRPAEWNLPEIRAAFKTLRILALIATSNPDVSLTSEHY